VITWRWPDPPTTRHQLLPDPNATVWFDDVTLHMTLPEELSQRITAHFRHFSQALTT